ncbi:MAG: flagellar export protein FliJ [Chloroflexi bacterium]|nr:flagellar export protein FliJ [Chloroflexota bacterium]
MPKRNAFRLQPVLDYREHVEETLRVALAELERLLQKETKTLGILRDRHVVSMEGMLGHQESAQLDVPRIGLDLLYIQSLEERIKVQEQLIASIQDAVDRQREQLIEAAKEKKQLEKLKESAEARVKQELKLEENRTTDDISMVQFNHKIRSRKQAIESHSEG